MQLMELLREISLLDSLAVAYAEAGQFTNAVRVQQEVLGLLRDEKRREGYSSRLKLYQSNSPYREPGEDVLSPAPESPQQMAALLRVRGILGAQYGRWQGAITNFIKATELNPSDHLSWYLVAPLLVERGNWAAYDKHRQGMLARFGATNDPPTAQRMAKGALLLPLSGADLVTTAALAETGLREGIGMTDGDLRSPSPLVAG